MEKISRIIPASPRLQAVDMDRERPVRASTPSFGQPVSNSVNRGPIRHAVDEATRTYRETYGPDAKLAREAEVVKKMSDAFFAKRGTTPVQVSVPVEQESVDFVGREPVESSGQESLETVETVETIEARDPNFSSSISIRA